MEKLIKENGDKLPEGDRKDAETALTEGKEALASMDKERIQKALENITAKSHKLAEAIYKDTTPPPPAGGGGAAPGGEQKKDDDVIDAEVVS